MSEAQPKAKRNGAKRRAPKRTYRGIELQRPYGEPTIPIEEIQRAVKEAFSKHAHLFAKD